MPLLQRQVNFKLARGQQDSIVDAVSFPWRFRDIEPRNKLKLEEGMYISQQLMLASGASLTTIPLPQLYTDASNLAFFLLCNQNLELRLTSPSATNNFNLKGTKGTTDGDHPAIFSHQGRVTSIQLSNPVSLGTIALVEYFAYMIPDLSDPDSWKDGVQTTGVVS